MKNFRLLALSLLSASMFMFTSCEEDEEPTLGPTMSMQETNSGATSGNITVAPNSTLVFTWDARSGDSRLETFRISLSGVNVVNPIPTSEQGNDFPYDIRNADNDNYLDTLMINSGTNDGNTTYSFTVVDRDGNEEDVSFTVTVESSTPMNTEVTGAFFHIGGTLQGAYNLVGETQMAVGDNDAEKDMVNTDAPGTAFTGSWEAGVTNTTTYVQANGFDYANATVEAAETAFNNGNASASVADPADGDIYIAKLRGGNNYAVINVTNVDPTDNTCNCGNPGKIEFDFKKQ